MRKVDTINELKKQFQQRYQEEKQLLERVLDCQIMETIDPKEPCNVTVTKLKW